MTRTHREHAAKERLRIAQFSPLLQLLGRLKGKFGQGLLLADLGLPAGQWLGVFRRRASVRPPFLARRCCALCTLGRRAFDPKPVHQRLEPRTIKARSPDRTGVNRLSYLDQTCGVDWTLGLVKRNTAIVPLNAAMRYKPSRLTCQVFDEVFVSDFKHSSRRQNGPPMVQHCFVSLVVATEFAEIIGKWLVLSEQQRIARHAGVDGAAPDMDDPGARKRQMNKAREQEISRQLVDDTIFRCPLPAQSFDVDLSELPAVLVRHLGEQVRVRARSSLRDIGYCGRKMVDLAGAEDARVTGEDLLDEARARARHADDKDRGFRVMSDIGFRIQKLLGRCIANTLHQHQGLVFVIGYVPPLETIAGFEMTERAVRVLEVGIGLSEREVQHNALIVGKPILAGM